MAVGVTKKKIKSLIKLQNTVEEEKGSGSEPQIRGHSRKKTTL